MSILDIIVGFLIGLETQYYLCRYVTKGKEIIPLSWIVDFAIKQEKKEKEKEKKV